MDVHQTQKIPTIDAADTKEAPPTLRPLAVKVIVIVMLISAVASFIFGFSEGDATYFIGGILLFAVLYGLWHMRRWALYLFTLLVIALVAVSAYEYLTGEIDAEEFLFNSGLPAPLLMLTYLWSNAGKFR